MNDQTPPTETITAADARQHFASVINRVARKQSRVLVEKSGIPVAGIVSAEDLRRLDQLDEERAEQFSIIDEMRAAFREIPDEEIEREAARTIAAIRAKRRVGHDQSAFPRSSS